MPYAKKQQAQHHLPIMGKSLEGQSPPLALITLLLAEAIHAIAKQQQIEYIQDKRANRNCFSNSHIDRTVCQ
jgi:hypothetical protein